MRGSLNQPCAFIDFSYSLALGHLGGSTRDNLLYVAVEYMV